MDGDNLLMDYAQGAARSALILNQPLWSNFLRSPLYAYLMSILLISIYNRTGYAVSILFSTIVDPRADFTRNKKVFRPRNTSKNTW